MSLFEKQGQKSRLKQINMVIERKEPTISTGTNNSGTAQSPNVKKARQAGPQGDRPIRTEPKVIVEKQSSGLLWFTLLLTLATIALAGYSFWQLQQSAILIAEQQVRLNELENKLLLTGDESTQSLTALTSNVKALDRDVTLAISEVDKLWATRNTNVKAIETLKADVNASMKTLESSLSKSISSATQQNASQEILIETLRENTAAVTKKTSALENQIKQFSASIKKVDQMSNTLSGYEETIRSFDKFRLSTNRDLLALKERAGVL